MPGITHVRVTLDYTWTAPWTPSLCWCVLVPAATSPSHPKQKVKPPVPARTEKPLMGLTSNKNYITSNASKCMCPARAGRSPSTVLSTVHKGFQHSNT